MNNNIYIMRTPDTRLWEHTPEGNWRSDAFVLEHHKGGDMGWSLFHNNAFVGVVVTIEELERVVATIEELERVVRNHLQKG